jgi:asparagine synthase (glutamine-hydrolysing)
VCGIAGLVAPDLPAEEVARRVEQMTATLVHRGPDDDGFFVADGVGLGMRRLRIIDLEGGHQPKSSEDGAVQVVLNGEIYNYLELREALVQNGHALHTRSDTEVLPHLYEEGGPGFAARLRGMFTVAAWDAGRRRLVLVRDRLGKKPLFYAQLGDRLVFGSEIKALLAAEPELREQDDASLEWYFRLGYVPEPFTMFRRIRKVPAAHQLVFEGGRVSIESYWHVEMPGGGPQRRAEDVREELDALLAEAVEIRLLSDVPLGVFLSGGLDSSAVVAYAHRAGLHPLKTFTVGFDRPEWDESADARLVAEHFGTEHHVLSLTERDLAADLPGTVRALVRHLDEPFGDSSAFPTYLISRLAREHVTVILGGDGGDELFAGYTIYRGVRFAQRYRRLPGWLAGGIVPRVADGVARVAPGSRRYAAQRAAKVLRDSLLPFEDLYFSKVSLCSDALLQELLRQDVRRRPHPLPDDVAAALAGDAPDLDRLAYVDLRLHLLEKMLVKVDRMSMAHSLEVRSPFLDHRLVEFVSALPADLKLRGSESKAILRDVLRPQLPESTMRKGKQGFSVPLREWMRGPLHDMVADSLHGAGGLAADGPVDRTVARRLLAEHRRGERDHSGVLWLLLNYAAWRELYLEGAASPDVASTLAPS